MKFLILLALFAGCAYASGGWGRSRGDDHWGNDRGSRGGWGSDLGHGRGNDNGHRVILIQRDDSHGRNYDNGHQVWSVSNRNSGHRVNEGGWARGKLSAGAGAGQGSGLDTGSHW